MCTRRESNPLTPFRDPRLKVWCIAPVCHRYILVCFGGRCEKPVNTFLPNFPSTLSMRPGRRPHHRALDLTMGDRFELSRGDCDPRGVRTLDPLVKSQVLYQLSYEINSLFQYVKEHKKIPNLSKRDFFS